VRLAGAWPGRRAVYTELEFLTAGEVGLPRLFVIDDDVAVPRSLVDRDGGAVDGFRERLRRAGVIVKAVGVPVDLGEARIVTSVAIVRHGHASSRRVTFTTPRWEVALRQQGTVMPISDDMSELWRLGDK
jgi:hypothetical protein